MYQAYLSTYKVDVRRLESPAKATWTDVSASAGQRLPQGSTAASTRSCSPTTDRPDLRVAARPGRLADLLHRRRRQDLVPSTGGGIPSGVDHQTIGGGAFSADGVGALPDLDLPERRLLLQPGHRHRVLRGLP